MKITHLKLAQICEYSYEKGSLLKSMGWSYIKEINNIHTGTTCYLCYHNKTRQVVVVFRGSDSSLDIKTNLKFLKVRTPLNRRLHKGFLDAYKSIREPLHRDIDKLVGWDIYATGHSLGGALACIFGLQSPTKVKEIVTFGQPRLIGANGQESLYKLPLTRYVNQADIVARIPVIGYSHSGEEIFITSKREFLINPSKTFIFLDSLWKVFNFIKHHRIGNYVNELSYKMKPS